MSALDLAALRVTPVTREPFEYLIVPGFVKAEARASINADYPQINRPGSFPVGGLHYGPAFRSLLAELNGPELRDVFEKKFRIDLTGRPTMTTVRGRCWEKDGHIHTDAVTKLITVLIYMNPTWEQPGGRLRLLRSATDIEDVIVEVPPLEGTLLAFRRSDNSFHGHKVFTGERRVIQFNWVTDQRVLQREVMRHRFSAVMKTLLPLGWFPFLRRENRAVAGREYQ
jgi:hypothetical protein